MDRSSPTAQKLRTGKPGTDKLGTGKPGTDTPGSTRRKARPTVTQLAWLGRGLDQAGGKLPLFDRYGQRYDQRTIRSCIEQGWAEPWFNNPIKPDWMVCRLTADGRQVAEAGEALAEANEDEPGEARVRNLVDNLFA